MVTSRRQPWRERREGRTGPHEDGFRPEFCAGVIDEMRAGFSLGAFAGSIGVSQAVLEGWLKTHAGFAEAVAAGRAARLRYWEEAALRVVTAGGAAGAVSIILATLKAISPDEHGAAAREEPVGDAAEPEAHVDDGTLARATALILQRGYDAARAR
jgi:hypothetical protein